MYAAIAKSTFIHRGNLYEPGDMIRLPGDDEADPDEKTRDEFVDDNLVALPRPEVHRAIRPIEGTEGMAYAISRGGGWYDVIETDGWIVEENCQGLSAAEETALAHLGIGIEAETETEDETDADSE